MTAGFKKILIIKPSSLGDIVLALPALTALHRSFPDAKISWLVRPAFAPLLENHPHLDEIIPFERKFLGKAWFHPGALAALVSLISRLRKSDYDAVFDFQGLFRTSSFAWMSGCKRRFGMANAREFAHYFYTNKVSQDSSCKHLVDFYLKIVRAAGADGHSPEFVLPLDEGAAESVKRLLACHGIKNDNYAVLVPGSAHEDKCWPIESFADLAERISSRFGLAIVATGTEPEAGVVEKLRGKASVPIANLAGRTSLAELIALQRNAKLVVSNDTGPGHIAAAAGVPLVLIFGRSNPVRVGPYGREHCIVAIEPQGRGLAINSTNPKHDIKNITVEQVYQSVLGQLDKPQPGDRRNSNSNVRRPETQQSNCE